MWFEIMVLYNEIFCNKMKGNESKKVNVMDG